MPRLLMAFPQCAHDMASGAARSTRVIGEWLASSGWEVRAVTTAFSESRRWWTAEEFRGVVGDGLTEEAGGWVKFNASGVAHRVLAARRRQQTALDADAVVELVRGVRRAIARFRPDVFLTYGDDAVWRDLRREAKEEGARVVYAVHNAAHAVEAFASADAVLAPSEWLAKHYAARGGRGLHALPPPIEAAETVASAHERVFTTWINPSPEKGRAVFLGIARALAERRSAVPLLVVQGRATGADLLGAAEQAGIDLRAMNNLMIAPAVAQPREIFRLTRTLLVPSLCEAAGRVVAEAQLNGIPCLVSDRGGLPEMCGDGGRIFALPESVTLETSVVGADVVGPWVDEIERLANNEGGYRAASEAARRAGGRFERDALLARYVEWFLGLARRGFALRGERADLR